MKISLLCLILLFFTGCRGGQIGISANTSQPTSQPNVLQQSRKQVAKGPKILSPVYFVAMDLNDSDILIPKGIGFLPVQSKTHTPYVFHFRTDPKSNLQTLSTGNNGTIIHIRAIDSFHDALTETHIPDLETEDLYIHKSQIRSVTKGVKSSWMSFVDDQGQVFIKTNDNEEITNLNLPSFFAKAVRVANSGGRMIIRGENLKNPEVPKSEIIVMDLSKAAKPLAEIEAVDGSLDDSGHWLSYVTGSPHAETLSIVNLEDAGQKSDLDTVKGVSHLQMSWLKSDLLAYVTSDTEKKVSLKVYNLNAKATSIVYTIQNPYNFPLSKWICPIWKGKSLFFGGVSSEKMEILRADLSSSRWTVQPFAVPQNRQTGYICPQQEASL